MNFFLCSLSYWHLPLGNLPHNWEEGSQKDQVMQSIASSSEDQRRPERVENRSGRSGNRKYCAQRYRRGQISEIFMN